MLNRNALVSLAVRQGDGEGVLGREDLRAYRGDVDAANTPHDDDARAEGLSHPRWKGRSSLDLADHDVFERGEGGVGEDAHHRWFTDPGHKAHGSTEALAHQD